MAVMSVVRVVGVAVLVVEAPALAGVERRRRGDVLPRFGRVHGLRSRDAFRDHAHERDTAVRGAFRLVNLARDARRCLRQVGPPLARTAPRVRLPKAPRWQGCGITSNRSIRSEASPRIMVERDAASRKCPRKIKQREARCSWHRWKASSRSRAGRT